MDLFSMNKSEQAVFLVYEGDKNGNHIPDAEEIGVKPLKGDGDFRSNECIELLKEADVVVTNPPFLCFVSMWLNCWNMIKVLDNWAPKRFVL